MARDGRWRAPARTPPGPVASASVHRPIPEQQLTFERHITSPRTAPPTETTANRRRSQLPPKPHIRSADPSKPRPPSPQYGGRRRMRQNQFKRTNLDHHPRTRRPPRHSRAMLRRPASVPAGAACVCDRIGSSRDGACARPGRYFPAAGRHATGRRRISEGPRASERQHTSGMRRTQGRGHSAGTGVDAGRCRCTGPDVCADAGRRSGH